MGCALLQHVGCLLLGGGAALGKLGVPRSTCPPTWLLPVESWVACECAGPDALSMNNSNTDALSMNNSNLTNLAFLHPHIHRSDPRGDPCRSSGLVLHVTRLKRALGQQIVVR